MTQPLVSIVILNYKRLDALAQAIQSVSSQEYANKEIIVVDNHSEEDVGAVVRRFGPEVKLIELDYNGGSCVGRNAGLRAARGEILLTLDNDIHFESPFELSKVVNKFEQRPDIAVLAFRVGEPGTGALRMREWCHPRSWKQYGDSEFETHFFVEGAVAYRREALDKTGVYYDPLFIYTEGYDLALRLLDHGCRILYCPTIRVNHLMSPGGRTRGGTYYYFTRNYIWIAHKDYRFWSGLKFLVPKLGMMTLFTLRSGFIAPFLRGVKDGIAGLARIHRERTPISRETERYVTELERYRPSLFFRLARHRVGPQL